MNRADRGSLLLIVAGVLLMLAIVAYLINEAEDQSRHVEATCERQALEAQARHSIAEMRVLRDENDRFRRDRDGIRAQQEEILRSLERMEKLLGGAPPVPGRRRSGGLDVPSSALDASRRPGWRAEADRHPV